MSMRAAGPREAAQTRYQDAQAACMMRHDQGEKLESAGEVGAARRARWAEHKAR